VGELGSNAAVVCGLTVTTHTRDSYEDTDDVFYINANGNIGTFENGQLKAANGSNVSRVCSLAKSGWSCWASLFRVPRSATS
jgi:hypothetical protein